MGLHIITLLVTEEQENAIRNLFHGRGWKFEKTGSRAVPGNKEQAEDETETVSKASSQEINKPTAVVFGEEQQHQQCSLLVAGSTIDTGLSLFRPYTSDIELHHSLDMKAESSKNGEISRMNQGAFLSHSTSGFVEFHSDLIHFPENGNINISEKASHSLGVSNRNFSCDDESRQCSNMRTELHLNTLTNSEHDKLATCNDGRDLEAKTEKFSHATIFDNSEQVVIRNEVNTSFSPDAKVEPKTICALPYSRDLQTNNGDAMLSNVQKHLDADAVFKFLKQLFVADIEHILTNPKQREIILTVGQILMLNGFAIEEDTLIKLQEPYSHNEHRWDTEKLQCDYICSKSDWDIVQQEKAKEVKVDAKVKLKNLHLKRNKSTKSYKKTEKAKAVKIEQPFKFGINSEEVSPGSEDPLQGTLASTSASLDDSDENTLDNYSLPFVEMVSSFKNENLTQSNNLLNIKNEKTQIKRRGKYKVKNKTKKIDSSKYRWTMNRNLRMHNFHKKCKVPPEDLDSDNYSPSEKGYFCHDCSFIFRGKNKIVLHKQMRVGKCLPDCIYCDMEEHKEVFQCDKCPKCFPTKELFDRHCLRHLFDLMCCNFCDAKFYTIQELKLHLQSDHAQAIQKSYLCDLCGSSFKEKKILNAHRKFTHSEDRPETCPTCGRGFKTKSQLKNHLVIHQNVSDLNLSCEVCGKMFVRAATLRDHVRRHNKEFSCYCTVCNKGFYRKYGLEEHMRTHTGDKPFSCEVCGYKCALGCNLLKHMKVHKKR